jgi:uncharacterized protein (DUF924 family)
MGPIASFDDVLAFWRAAGPKKWFKKDLNFDAEIVARFLKTFEAAAAGELGAWELGAENALALIIVLDQFPRNMFRGSARAFAADPLARAVADRGLARGFDQNIALSERNFFYLPFTHSENLGDQERCVALSRATGDADALKWADIHADVIRRFGRFPHRNVVLGRITSVAEQAFLDGSGFSG